MDTNLHGHCFGTFWYLYAVSFPCNNLLDFPLSLIYRHNPVLANRNNVFLLLLHWNDQEICLLYKYADLIPYPDQWTLLESVNKIDEKLLDEIIGLNEFYKKNASCNETTSPQERKNRNNYGLPVCIQTILQNGVGLDRLPYREEFKIDLHFTFIMIYN